MKYSSDSVLKILEDYQALKEKQTLLQYELTHPAQITESELLQARAFPQKQSDLSPRGYVERNDRQLMLALNYRKETCAANQEVIDTILEELRAVTNQITRLEFYMDLLSPEQTLILRLIYLEKKSWGEIETIMGLSRRTLVRRRADAVEKLVEMYNYAEQFRTE